MKIDGSLAQNIDFEDVDFEATKYENWRKSRTKCSFWCSSVSRLESLVFLWPRRVYGGSCKTYPVSKVSKQVVMSFAWQAWHCDIPTCLITCRKSFCVAGAIFLRRFHKMSCSFRGRRSTLETSIAILRGRRSTSDVSHCVLYTSHSTLYTPHSALYTSHSTLYISHSTLYTSTLYLRLWKYQGSLRPYVKNDSIYDFNCFNMRNYIYIFFF